MDVADIITTMNQNMSENDAGVLISVLVGVFIGVTLFVLGVIKSARDARNNRNDRHGQWISLSFIGLSLGALIGYGLGTVLVPVTDYEHQVSAMEQVSERVSDTYGVDISRERIQKAWFAADDEVVTVATEHDGVEKSLGVSFDRGAMEVTVFEGNVALEPVK